MKDLTVADGWIQKIQGEAKPDAKKKLIASGAKHVPVLASSAKKYMKTLDDAARDEIAENNEKTVYARGLKFLRNELGALDKINQAAISSSEIALNTDLDGKQKAARMLGKALAACVANASAGVKKVKANPTEDQFNQIFNVTDNVARKLQVQLVTAANEQKKGGLPPMIVDPRFIADKLTPWQAGGKGRAIAPKGATKDVVIKQTEEFNALLKFAARFLADLQDKGG